jgi:O-antigen/teichoic acid export membrane protein
MNSSATLDISTGTARLLRAARTSPLLRQAGQMITTRGIGLGVAAAGSIWAARCLGPEKLGISGMILSVLAPMTLLVDLNQDVSLVRRYKTCETDAARVQLIRETFLFRGLLCLAYMAVTACVLAITGLPGANWSLGVMAAFPLLMVSVNQGAWVLQAQENMPARYRALMLQSAISAACYFAVFRPGRMPAGSDIIVMAAAVGVEYSLGWWYARRPLQSAHPSKPVSTVWQRSEWIRSLRSAGHACWAGRWVAITGLVSYLYLYLQSPMVGLLLGNEALGQYRTAGTLLNAFQAFAAMIPALLYPRMIEWHRIGPAHLWTQQIRFARVALCLFIPGALAAFFLAPHIYRLLYGAVFLSAAYPFALLLVSKMIAVLSGIFCWGLWAQHRDGLVLKLTAATAFLSLPLNFCLIPRLGLRGAAGVCVICEILMLLATAGASRALIRQSTAIPESGAKSVKPD